MSYSLTFFLLVLILLRNPLFISFNTWLSGEIWFSFFFLIFIFAFFLCNKHIHWTLDSWLFLFIFRWSRFFRFSFFCRLFFVCFFLILPLFLFARTTRKCRLIELSSLTIGVVLGFLLFRHVSILFFHMSTLSKGDFEKMSRSDLYSEYHEGIIRLGGY